ncbi:MAG: FKBP-type peptidyl-prolyl cis-trans isomerase [Verrucomicrobiota bacterium]|nr:FKBP-type peptidyl-prolyl cis-trans isomerase [Verrucomicrobiota bacterium]
MKKILCVLFATSSLFCAEDAQLLSEALGHVIGQNIKALEFSIDSAALAKGLMDEAEGKPSPLSLEECMRRLALLEEALEEKCKEKNLQEAEAFLARNQEKEKMHILCEGKVQWEELRAGEGDELSSHNHPLVRCKGTFLDGTVCTSSEEEIIALEEALPGLKEGMAHMREGEIRRIYIHPEFAYGESDPVQPGSLVIFEVELLELEGHLTPSALLSDWDDEKS